MALQPSITTLKFRNLLEDSNLRKCVVSALINLAHPEGFEPPTTWLEASVFFSAVFRTTNLVIIVHQSSHKFWSYGELNPSNANIRLVVVGG